VDPLHRRGAAGLFSCEVLLDLLLESRRRTVGPTDVNRGLAACRSGSRRRTHRNHDPSRWRRQPSPVQL